MENHKLVDLDSYPFYPEKAYNKEMANSFKELASSFIFDEEINQDKLFMDIINLLEFYFEDLYSFITSYERKALRDIYYHKTLVFYMAPRNYKRNKYNKNKRIKFNKEAVKNELYYFRVRINRMYSKDDILQILYMKSFELLNYLRKNKDKPRKNKQPLNVVNYYFHIFPRNFIQYMAHSISGLSTVIPYLDDLDIEENLKYSYEIENYIDLSYDEDNDTLTNEWLLNINNACSYPFNCLDYTARYIYKTLYYDKHTIRDTAYALGYLHNAFHIKRRVYNSQLKDLLDYPEDKKIFANKNQF